MNNLVRERDFVDSHSLDPHAALFDHCAVNENNLANAGHKSIPHVWVLSVLYQKEGLGVLSVLALIANNNKIAFIVVNLQRAANLDVIVVLERCLNSNARSHNKREKRGEQQNNFFHFFPPARQTPNS
jgi:hypothetical protein